jgi:hypothetical protein
VAPSVANVVARTMSLGTLNKVRLDTPYAPSIATFLAQLRYDTPYAPSIATLDKCGADYCFHGDDMPVDANGKGAYDEMRDADRLVIVREKYVKQHHADEGCGQACDCEGEICTTGISVIKYDILLSNAQISY